MGKHPANVQHIVDADCFFPASVININKYFITVSWGGSTKHPMTQKQPKYVKLCDNVNIIRIGNMWVFFLISIETVAQIFEDTELSEATFHNGMGSMQLLDTGIFFGKLFHNPCVQCSISVNAHHTGTHTCTHRRWSQIRSETRSFSGARPQTLYYSITCRKLITM